MGNWPVTDDSDLLPPEVGTKLIVRPNIPSKLTPDRETDVRTALTRGLAEYLSQLSVDAIGGRRLFLKRVFQTWAEPEDEAFYPSAAVYAEGTGTYDASKFVPTPQQSKNLVLHDGRVFVSPCEFVLDILLDVWANDPDARMDLVSMIEDAMNPTDWRYGPLLELPHYHNERASYEMMSMSYIDDEDSSQRRIRRAHFVIRGRVPLIRVMQFPQAKIRTKVEVTDGNEDC